MKNTQYDVIIIGGGASGTALLYVLAKYTDIPRIALVEKYPTLGSVNSNAKNNSQTLHVGDIETNYSLEKVVAVKPAAELILGYTKTLPQSEQDLILKKIPKLVLGVGATEVAVLTERYHGLKKIFSGIELIGPERLSVLEPNIMTGRNPAEPVIAIFNPNGYAVNFGELANSLAQQALIQPNKTIDIFTNETVVKIEKNLSGYILHTTKNNFQATAVVVDADAYSLSFAKKLGYGHNFSLIPIAGTFYFSPSKLQSKVYTVQEPHLPFAAVHGDPDLTKADVTRWGPTARFFPVLESRRYSSCIAYLRSSGLHRISTWLSFATILFEPIRFNYLLKNILYELPLIGKYLFLSHIKKIIPAIKATDLVRAKGYGGMRLQRVDTTTRELLLGEGKIIGDMIIFNMTPSPGASVCLHNAKRDAEKIMEFFHNRFHFQSAELYRDLDSTEQALTTDSDTSLSNSYAS